MSKNGRRIHFRIDIVVEPDDGEFHAYCPALKGLHTCGKTRKDALKNARNAAEAYIESLIKHDDPIPVEVIVEPREPGVVAGAERYFRHAKTKECARSVPSVKHYHHTEELSVLVV